MHCYGHALNLAVADAIKSVPISWFRASVIHLTQYARLESWVKKSSQRNTKFYKIRAETKNESRGVHAFCPTRWTVGVAKH